MEIDTPTLRVQVMSDIHLEFPSATHDVTPKADYLALIGDIGTMRNDKYQNFLLLQAERFKKVFVVMGNHEYYGSTVKDTVDKIKSICDSHPNLELLQKKSLLIEGKRVLGTTLWSYVPPTSESVITRCLNDYKVITIEDQVTKKSRLLSVKDTNAWFEDELAWIKAEIEKAKENKEDVIIFTHHSPISDGSHPKFFGSDINPAFCTDLNYLMGTPVKVWCYGHTHYSQDIMRNGTRIVANAKGYPHEQTGAVFNPDLVVEL